MPPVVSESERECYTPEWIHRVMPMRRAECRRHAPIYVPAKPLAIEARPAWPATQADDGCGDHEPIAP